MRKEANFSQEERNITQRLEKVFNGYEDLDDILTLQQVKRDIKALENAKRSARPSRLETVYRDLEKAGIQFEKNRDADYYQKLVESVPTGESAFQTADGLEKKILDYLYKCYTAYPSPVDYLERCMNDLRPASDARWPEDPLRLQLLKQIMLYGDGLKYPGMDGKSSYIYGGAPAIKKYAKNLAGKQGFNKPLKTNKEVVEWIDDGVFELLKISETDLDKVKISQEDLKTAGISFESLRQRGVTDGLINRIKAMSQKDKENSLDPDTLAVYSRVSQGLKKLKSIKEEQRKPDGTYGILQAVNEVSEGHFYAQGATKRMLYVLAILFDLDWNGLNPDSTADYSRTIEKVMFKDFYENNLIRFLDEIYEVNPFSMELVPDGQGINYKNFTEAVYIYYLCRKNLSREDRLKGAAAMVDRIKRQNRDPKKKAAEPGITSVFRDLYSENLDTMEKLGALSEREFYEFVTGNYNCNTYIRAVDADGKEKPYITSDMSLENDQKSAWTIYRQLSKRLDDLTDGESDLQRFGLSFFATQADGLPLGQILPDNFSDYERFLRLLKIVDHFLLEKTLGLEGPQSMNRTVLISMLYKVFWLESDSNFAISSQRSFAETFAAFQQMADESLINAGYQPVNIKSFFDIALVISAYASAVL